MSPSSSIQRSISHMRSLTGGDVSGSPGSGAISLVNRKLSPYNSNINLVNNLLAPTFFAKNSSLRPDILEHANVLVGGQVATVTQESSNVLDAGIPIYVNIIGVATANAFMTIFFISLILIAITATILGLGYLSLLAVKHTTWGKQRQAMLEEVESSYPAFARAWGLRIVVICLMPVFIFAFCQWTLNDSWLTVFLSVILFLAVLVCIALPIIFVFRPVLFFRWIGDVEPSQSTTLLPLIASLRSNRYYYIIALFTAILVKTLVIAFGQAHGMVQTIVILITEALLLVILLVLRPHHTRGADIFATFLAIIRVLCTGPMIAFSESLNLQAIPRVVVGIVLAVIWSIVVVIMFLNILVNLGLWRLFRRVVLWKRGRSVPTDATALSSNAQSLEEGKQVDRDRSSEKLSVTPAPSTMYLERPNNPSPTHTPTTASAFTPTTTLSRFSDPPSIYTPMTTTTTTTSALGELLPRRWSFQHSRPPSASAVSHYSGTLSPRSPITPTATTTESGYATPRESWRPPSSAYEHSSNSHARQSS